MSPMPHELLADLIGNGAIHFKTTGLGVGGGLALVMVLWTSFKMTAARRSDAWEATRIVVFLGVAWTILEFF